MSRNKEATIDRTVWVDGSISPEQVSQVIMGSLSELVTEGDSLSHVGTQGGSGDEGPKLYLVAIAPTLMLTLAILLLLLQPFV